MFLKLGSRPFKPKGLYFRVFVSIKTPICSRQTATSFASGPRNDCSSKTIVLSLQQLMQNGLIPHCGFCIMLLNWIKNQLIVFNATVTRFCTTKNFITFSFLISWSSIVICLIKLFFTCWAFRNSSSHFLLYKNEHIFQQLLRDPLQISFLIISELKRINMKENHRFADVFRGNS